MGEGGQRPGRFMSGIKARYSNSGWVGHRAQI